MSDDNERDLDALLAEHSGDEDDLIEGIIKLARQYEMKITQLTAQLAEARNLVYSQSRFTTPPLLFWHPTIFDTNR
jgi:hypothetical protein